MENSYPAEIERLMEAKGFTKQRGTGVSVSALARATGVHIDTVKNLLLHGRASRPRTVELVAEALGVSESRLLKLVGRDGGEVYVGPDPTRHMTARERAALTEFLLATLENRKAGVGSHADSTAANNEAGEDVPAHDEDWNEMDLAAQKGFKGEPPGQLHDDAP